MTGENWTPSFERLNNRLCKQCANAYQVERARANKHEMAVWRAANKDAIREYGAKYYAENKADIKARLNKAVKRASAANRRARQKAAFDPSADQTKIAAIYAMAERLTKLTGQEYHVDHIQPLSRGGKHHEDNLVVMTAGLNMRKHSQHWPWLTWFNG